MIKKIGTHNGTFHADEVTGCMLLTNFINEYIGAEIIRTRDKNILSKLDLILDVGDEYDHEKKRYDHHHKEFNETFDKNHNIRLSASGLIFKHYGKEIIQNSINYWFKEDIDFQEKYQFELNEDNLNKFYLDLYNDFFEGLDGLDNGVLQIPKDTKMNYKTYSTELGTRIASLNFNWFSNEDGKNQEERFRMAMELSKNDFLMNLKKHYFSFISLPLVKKFVQKRLEISNSGQIIFLEEPCFWKKAIFEVEKDLNIEGLIKYIIFKDKTNNNHRIQCVPKNLGSFENRISWKKEWNGKRDEELSKISNIDDIIFVHNSGFIGGAKSFESCIKMGEISLEQN